MIQDFSTHTVDLRNRPFLPSLLWQLSDRYPNLNRLDLRGASFYDVPLLTEMERGLTLETLFKNFPNHPTLHIYYSSIDWNGVLQSEELSPETKKAIQALLLKKEPSYEEQHAVANRAATELLQYAKGSFSTLQPTSQHALRTLGPWVKELDVRGVPLLVERVRNYSILFPMLKRLTVKKCVWLSTHILDPNRGLFPFFPTHRNLTISGQNALFPVAANAPTASAAPLIQKKASTISLELLPADSKRDEKKRESIEKLTRVFEALALAESRVVPHTSKAAMLPGNAVGRIMTCLYPKVVLTTLPVQGLAKTYKDALSLLSTAKGFRPYHTLLSKTLAQLNAISPLLLPIQRMAQTQDEKQFLSVLDALIPTDGIRELDYRMASVSGNSFSWLEAISKNFSKIQKLKAPCLEMDLNKMQLFTKFSHLRSLDLTNIQGITDEMLQPLSQMTTLEVLTLDTTKLTIKGIQHLRPLTELVALRVTNSPGIDGRAFAIIATQFRKLMTLITGRTAMTKKGLLAISKIGTLHTFIMGPEKNFQPEWLRVLPKFPALHSLVLELSDTLTLQGLMTLPPLKQVKELTILNCKEIPNTFQNCLAGVLTEGSRICLLSEKKGNI